MRILSSNLWGKRCPTSARQRRQGCSQDRPKGSRQSIVITYCRIADGSVGKTPPKGTPVSDGASEMPARAPSEQRKPGQGANTLRRTSWGSRGSPSTVLFAAHAQPEILSVGSGSFAEGPSVPSARGAGSSLLVRVSPPGDLPASPVKNPRAASRGPEAKWPRAPRSEGRAGCRAAGSP